MRELKFNEEMQRAKDEGRKTQTRRVLEGLVIDEGSGYVFYNDIQIDIHDWKDRIIQYCPYGKVGDINNGCLITDIRVERLQDITEDDAIAEGIYIHEVCNGDDYSSYPKNYLVSNKDADGWPYFKEEQYIESFMSLWDSIYPNHPTKAWELNPYVWVITFENVEQ